jgi:hypothetical protein
VGLQHGREAQSIGFLNSLKIKQEICVINVQKGQHSASVRMEEVGAARETVTRSQRTKVCKV